MKYSFIMLFTMQLLVLGDAYSCVPKEIGPQEKIITLKDSSFGDKKIKIITQKHRPIQFDIDGSQVYYNHDLNEGKGDWVLVSEDKEYEYKKSDFTWVVDQKNKKSKKTSDVAQLQPFENKETGMHSMRIFSLKSDGSVNYSAPYIEINPSKTIASQSWMIESKLANEGDKTDVTGSLEVSISNIRYRGGFSRRAKTKPRTDSQDVHELVNNTSRLSQKNCEHTAWKNEHYIEESEKVKSNTPSLSVQK